MHCALCLQERKLCKSHVIPESLYTSLYDEQHKFCFLPTNPELRPGTRPKGIYDRLLCRECEQHISSLCEVYLGLLIRTKMEVKIVKCGEHYLISGLDYKGFKFIFLTILWRAHTASRREFSDVDLGSDAEAIRKMILSCDPGPQSRYEITAVYAGLPDGLNKGLQPPLRLLIRGGLSYQMFFWGILWFVHIAPQYSHIGIEQSRLKETGEILVLHGGSRVCDLVMRSITAAVDRYDKVNPE